MIRKLILRNLFLLLAFPFAVVALAQSRSDDFPLETVKVTEIVLNPLADGGCTARWSGNASSADGGAFISTTTDTYELKAPVQQGRCQGLSVAGVNRIARGLRFNVDAGAP